MESRAFIVIIVVLLLLFCDNSAKSFSLARSDTTYN